MMDFNVLCNIVSVRRGGAFAVSREVADACSSCPRYGRRWGCPPFVDDMNDCRRYDSAVVVGVDVPATTDLRALRAAVEGVLLRYERILGGCAAALAGECPYCGSEADCTRLHDKPCRHPELVRPSLEAMGVDVVRLAAESLGRDVEWSGTRLLMVGAVFFNRSADTEPIVSQLSDDVSSAVGRLARVSRSRDS